MQHVRNGRIRDKVNESISIAYAGKPREFFSETALKQIQVHQSEQYQTATRQ